LFSTMRRSILSQNWGVSQSGTAGKMRAVVLLVSMMTCLQRGSHICRFKPCLPSDADERARATFLVTM
jgi:hypothetical protein